MKYFWLAATALWFALMTYLSHQGGAETAQTSLWLAALLGDLALDALLRRAAHVGLFFVLSTLVSLTLRSWKLDWRLSFLAFAWCFADEATKVLVDGRHFSWFDVGLNGIGAAAGILLSRGMALLRDGRGRTRDSGE
ncbi:MAG: VanZ family protein [Firmicutes bacterium]|nr:VanZ family protein [Bacillota bacterium]